MHTKRIRTNSLLTLAAILLCLVLVTTHFTCGLYAKYVDKTTTADAARVASFVIETDLDSVRLGTTDVSALQLGGTDEIQSVQIPFFIASDSEVAVGYSVAVDFGVPVPAYVDIALTDGVTSETIAADGSKQTFTFADFGTLPAAVSETQEAKLVLTLSISDLTAISEEVAIPAAALTVTVYQVD